MIEEIFKGIEKDLSLETITQLDDAELNQLIGKYNSCFSYYINNTEDINSIYYNLMNISGLNISTPIKLKLTEKIMDNQKFRQIVWDQSLIEIQESLKETLGIDSLKTLTEIRELILGKEFLEKGYSSKPNWNEFAKIIEPFIKNKLKNIPDKSNIIFWSKRDREFLNENFVTIENSTIGDKMFFLESLVYINWKSDLSSIPKFEPFWEELSSVYTNVVLKQLEESNVTTIPFYSTKDDNPENMFGDIFLKVELPLILKSQIETMNIITENSENYKLDLTDLKKAYFDMNEIDDKIANIKIQDEFMQQVSTLLEVRKVNGK